MGDAFSFTEKTSLVGPRVDVLPLPNTSVHHQPHAESSGVFIWNLLGRGRIQRCASALKNYLNTNQSGLFCNSAET
jgi:hypothetical protein